MIISSTFWDDGKLPDHNTFGLFLFLMTYNEFHYSEVFFLILVNCHWLCCFVNMYCTAIFSLKFLRKIIDHFMFFQKTTILVLRNVCRIIFFKTLFEFIAIRSTKNGTLVKPSYMWPFLENLIFCQHFNPKSWFI